MADRSNQARRVRYLTMRGGYAIRYAYRSPPHARKNSRQKAAVFYCCESKIGHRYEESSRWDDSSERTICVLSVETHKVFYHLTMRSISAVPFFGEQERMPQAFFQRKWPGGPFPHLLAQCAKKWVMAVWPTAQIKPDACAILPFAANPPYNALANKKNTCDYF